MKRQASTTTLNAKNLKALGATQRCLNPGFSERIGNSRRTGLDTTYATVTSPSRNVSANGAATCVKR